MTVCAATVCTLAGAASATAGGAASLAAVVFAVSGTAAASAALVVVSAVFAFSAVAAFWPQAASATIAAVKIRELPSRNLVPTPRSFRPACGTAGDAPPCRGRSPLRTGCRKPVIGQARTPLSRVALDIRVRHPVAKLAPAPIKGFPRPTSHLCEARAL